MQLPNRTYLELFRQTHDTHSQITTLIYQRQQLRTWNIPYNFNFSGENKVIFTMDITALFTVILNNEGLQALQCFFNQRPIKKPSSETLLCLAELVLTLNWSFNGVAKGTKMGLSYTNLFLGFIENKFFSNHLGPKADRHKRYIDDCVGATSSSRDGRT